MLDGISREMGALAAGGLIVVFGVLALIAIMVALLKKVDDRWLAQERDGAARAIERTPTIDQTTLILISAAAAVAVGGRFRVRRIRRLLSPQQKRTPWSAQGRLTLQGSHEVERRRDHW